MEVRAAIHEVALEHRGRYGRHPGRRSRAQRTRCNKQTGNDTD
jgi:hypothetical protein